MKNNQMPKIFHTWKWMSFAISSFVRIEEITLGLKHHKGRHFSCLARVAKETEHNVVKLVKLL
jgi:hypothetical protein